MYDIIIVNIVMHENIWMFTIENCCGHVKYIIHVNVLVL